MPLLKYTGASELIMVHGYGHFKPGDEKEVDEFTAAIFSDQRCVDEGFEVSTGGAARTPDKAGPASEAPEEGLALPTNAPTAPPTPPTFR
jgi:hypothetical protein